MHTKRLWFLVGLLMTVAGAGLGSIGGAHSISDLAQRANLIVLAAASGTYTPGSAATVSLQVSRVVKGDPALAGGVIAASWSGGTGGMIGPLNPVQQAAGAGIWFLQGSPGAWTLLPVTDGAIELSMTFFPASTDPILSVYAYDPSASLSDKIASEISAAIEGANGAYIPQFNDLQLGSLDALQSPVIQLLYQRLSTSTLVRQRAQGLSGLIRAGAGAALANATQAESTFTEDPIENGVLLQSVRDYFRATDSSSVAALGQVATDSANPNLPFRRATAHALAGIHTISTLPYLAALLDDADALLRTEGIGGIASFANGLPIQTTAGVPGLAHLQLPPSAPYKTPATVANFALGPQAIQGDESAYLSFWRQWWLQNKAALGY
ncbi:MAG: hypothetical protein ABSE35_21250 [Bryobacteraceae bacterium]